MHLLRLGDFLHEHLFRLLNLVSAVCKHSFRVSVVNLCLLLVHSLQLYSLVKEVVLFLLLLFRLLFQLLLLHELLSLEVEAVLLGPVRVDDDAVRQPPRVVPAWLELTTAQRCLLQNHVDVALSGSEPQAFQVSDSVLVLDDLDELLIKLLLRPLASLEEYLDLDVLVLVQLLLSVALEVVLLALPHELFVEVLASHGKFEFKIFIIKTRA